ncbi:hypothetical protein VKT23_013741 [Stygiomarasmius scandens]|uniref:Uncharacterized protein n=1 Tax=Marasmiellus scandens TaxID=2682957 RepID=A0ABR1J514_9AGAR
MSIRPEHPPSPADQRPRRPISPNTLRDLDLSHSPDMALRKYPAPPTGHDLMAMFPPPSPGNFPARPEPTSGYFEQQERAFFAQAGKEIVRVRLEVDLDSTDSAKPRSRDSAASPSWQTPVPSQSSPSASYNSSRSRAGTVTSPSVSLYHPGPPNLHPPPSHQQAHGLRTPPQDAPRAHSNPPLPPGPQPPDEYRDDPDESWRRPMPYAERRRAGKHTRRVIVRN